MCSWPTCTWRASSHRACAGHAGGSLAAPALSMKGSIALLFSPHGSCRHAIILMLSCFTTPRCCCTPPSALRILIATSCCRLLSLAHMECCLMSSSARLLLLFTPAMLLPAAARSRHGHLCVDHRSLWRLLCQRVQAWVQDQGLWGFHSRPWGHDRPHGLPGDLCFTCCLLTCLGGHGFAAAST